MAGVLGLGGSPGRFGVCPAYAGAPAAFGGEEFPQGRVDLIPDNVIMGDVDVGEDGLVELSPRGVAGAQVELVGVLEQVEVGFEEGPAAGEVVMDVSELFGEACPVAGDGPEPFADTVLWQGLVGGEVEEIVFFHGECLELVLKLLAVQPLRGRLIGEGALDEPFHRCDESGAELQGLVVLGDGIFDPVDAGVRGVAEVVLDPSAEVVAVVAGAMTSGGAHQDHAPVDTLLQAALPAPDGALQVVVVPLATLPGQATGGQDRLDAVEEVVGDDAFVPSGVELALIADLAQVVPVAKQLLDLRLGDRSGGPTGGGAGEQAAVGEFVGDVLEGLVASGVELKGELHERGALWIDLDGVDLASLEQVLHVEVAERCPAEGAAVLGFLAHLVGDVGAVGGGAIFVERGQHAVHQLAFGGGVDVLGG